jgi:protocatechuate 3,4-dioxygenase alpha subunit
MSQKNTLLQETPSQTAGPYVHIGCTPNFAEMTGVYDEDLGAKMKTGPVKGEKITITGHVIDGTGMAIRDAMIEIWQADADGSLPSTDSNFTGWGRCPTDMQTGAFHFDTIKPGQVPYLDGQLQAPHITVWIVARGINIGLHTRLYFEDEAEVNDTDPILSRIEHQNRVPTLVAKKQEDGTYLFDIHLQGENETIFFDM